MLLIIIYALISYSHISPLATFPISHTPKNFRQKISFDMNNYSRIPVTTTHLSGSGKTDEIG